MKLDMTKGKPYQLLLRFALPLMLSALLQQLYTMCDGMIVGRLLGTEAFAAVGMSSNLNWFPLSMLLGVTNGFGVALAQRFGAKDEEGFRCFFGAAMILSTVVGLVFTLVGLWGIQPFLHLVQTPDELMGHAIRYMRVLWAGLFFTASLNILSAALRAMGDSRTPFVSLVVSTLLNIVLDYALIQWCNMGIEGAAAATMLAQAAAAGWCLRGVIRKGNALPERRHLKPQKAVYCELLRLGIPPLLCNGVTASGELSMQAAFNACGVVFVTGVAAARRYFSLINVVGHGLQGALSTFVGQNWGAGEKQRIIQGTRTAALMSIGSSVAITALICVFAEPLILFFVPEGTAEAVRIGVDALRVEALFLVFLYLLCEYRAAIQGMGNALLPMLSGFLELVMRLGCSWLLPVWAGREGLYFIDAATWVVTTIMLWISYQVMRRKKLTV